MADVELTTALSELLVPVYSPPVPVTSDPTPVNLNNGVAYYEVTSGGSGGTEYLNIPNFALDGNGFNGQQLGRTIRLYFKTQTDPADKVTVQAGGITVVQVYEGLRQNVWYRQTDANGVVMDTEGQAVLFIWDGYEWAYSIWANSANDATLFSGAYSQNFGPGLDVGSIVAGGGFLRGATTTGTGQGGASGIQAGSSTAGRGGDATVAAGQGGGTGNGGNLHLTPGAALGSGTPGVIILDNYPTTDPMVDGAPWVDPVTRVVKVSAG